MFLPDCLKKAEFSLLRFRLEFQDSFIFTRDILLRIRRELNQIDRILDGAGDGDLNRHSLRRLLNPPLPTDPIALKRYQKFAPPFAFHPPPDLPVKLDPGDEFSFHVCFFGRGVQQIPLFVNALKLLGASGLYCGTGPYELLSVEAADFSGSYTTIWTEGEDPNAIAPSLLDIFWWLESSWVDLENIRMRFQTPTRLMKRGKPLFHPHFHDLFPYLLRRVSSILFACSGIEILDMATEALQHLKETSECNNRLQWDDWKRHETDGCVQELGGFTGTLDISGPGLLHIQWILMAGALMNVGKGSAFGNGHFMIEHF